MIAHRLLVLLTLVSCATPGAPVGREEGPPRALLVANVRPEAGRARLGGARADGDEPDFVLYSDGNVLYQQGQFGLLQVRLGEEEMVAIRHVIEQAFDSAVGDEDDRRVAFDLSDGPMLRMTSLSSDGCRRVYVHGMPGTAGAPSLPPPLSRLVALLRRFNHPQAARFVPEKVLVYLDAVPGSGAAAGRWNAWPRGWGSPRLMPVGGPGTHVVSFTPKALGGLERLEQIVRRGVTAPIEKDGRAYKVSAWRAILPDETRWRGDRMTGALPGCAG